MPDEERLSAVLDRFAGVVDTLKGDRLDAVRVLFMGIQESADSSAHDPDAFAAALAAAAADPEAQADPMIGEALRACSSELRRRALAGWRPAQVVAALKQHVPRLFELGPEGDDHDGGDQHE